MESGKLALLAVFMVFFGGIHEKTASVHSAGVEKERIVLISGAKTNRERQIVMLPKTTKIVTCEESRPFTAVKSARYSLPNQRGPGRRSARNCERDFTDRIASFCQGQTSCELSTLPRDLLNPCPSDNRLRFIVTYTCEEDAILLSIESDSDPMCGFLAFSRYCNTGGEE